MKVTIEKAGLISALSRCLPVTDPKSTMPVLANIWLEANKDNQHALELGATDLLRSMSLGVAGTIDQEGKICLPARDLFDRVKQLPDGKIALGCEGTKATIKTVGNARRFTLHGVPADEFPSLPEPTGTTAILKTTTQKLAQLIGAVSHAISTDDSRPHLNSLLLTSDESGMRLAATDGHRLATVISGAEPGPGATDWLIPLTAVNDIRKMLDVKNDQPVTLRQDRQHLFVEPGGFVFSTKLVDAQFPPWKQVVPSSSPRNVTLDRAALADALRAVSVSSSDRTGGVKFSFRKGTLVLQAESHDTGEGFDEVPTDYDGDTAEIGFNARYVLDALSSLACDQIVFSSGAELDPCAIRSASSEDFLAVVMPMRV